MTQLACPPVNLTTRQSTHGFEGRDHFTYDLTHPDVHDELVDIIGELLHDDIYDLQNFTKQGDVWVDAGCHVGVFSIAAMMAEADVSAMYDMDPAMAWCAEVNARAFLMQQLARQYRRRIRPVGIVKQLTQPDTLVSAAMQTRKVWEQGWDRACLKLDIQGAEQTILALDGPNKLAEAYDKMVLEWHYPDYLDWLMGQLERGGWTVVGIKEHEDILLNAKTYIVWAHSG